MFRRLTKDAENFFFPLLSVLFTLIVLYTVLKAAARYTPGPISNLARIATDAAGLDDDLDPAFGKVF